MTADESVLSNCLSTVLLGGGIQKSLLVKNCGNVVSAESQLLVLTLFWMKMEP